MAGSCVLIGRLGTTEHPRSVTASLPRPMRAADAEFSLVEPMGACAERSAEHATR